jgi:16S rRNA (adenine1518-N6/adenine1519-N6)-dimethyltransferase
LYKQKEYIVMTNANPMLQPANVRVALRSLGVRPTRAMGQNFLIDANALSAIVTAGVTADVHTVLEVGPGLGVLTWELLQRVPEVIAVELDARLAQRLHDQHAEATNLTIVQQDVLRTDITALTGGRPYHVVANLPYAITSPVLRHFLENDHPPIHMVVLVQREVAQRICATPGDMSVLAHAIQIRAEPDIVTIVPPESFLPAPAVHSAVLRLRVRPAPLVSPQDEPAVMRVIKAGFLHARKQIGNSLASGLAAHNVRIEKSDLQQLLTRLGIDPMRRAETLSLAEWQTITAALPLPHETA